MFVAPAHVAARLPAPVGSDGDDTGNPGLDLSNPRHARAIYLDLLGRTPDLDELQLAAGSSPSMMLRLLCGTHGFWQHWYEEQLYYFLLLDNFRPHDPGPGQRLPDLLASGDLDVCSALRATVGSSAFHRANPGNDTFVSVVFEQLLGMTVQKQPALLEAGKRMYDGHGASLWGQSGKSQSDVVRIAAAQPAFIERFVEREYSRFIGRAPGRKEAQRWSSELAHDPGLYADLVMGWLLSPAYGDRLQRLRRKSNRQFLQGLFVDLTGRPPDVETLERCRRALSAVADAGPLRSVIARVLLRADTLDLPSRDSLPVDDLVIHVFRRFLGRSPSPHEMDTFVTIFEQCECETDTLVRAVTTHWEYQYY
ncbi:MAG: hypothetical protein ACI9EF_002828 [Pseudohongiellaceae bacterium]|jgi:hypothetical protein